MKWFLNLKIRTKLLIGFILTSIITGIVGVIGISGIVTMSEDNNILYEKITKGIVDISRFHESLANLEICLRDAIKADTQSDIQRNLDLVRQAQENIQQEIDLIEDSALTDEERDLVKTIKNAQAKNIIYINQVSDLAAANRDSEAENILYGIDMKTSMEEEQKAVDNLANLKENLAQDYAADNSASARLTSTLMIIVSAAGVLIAVLLGIFLANIICKPVGNIVIAADKIAAGDMNIELNVNNNDEIGNLSKSVDKIVQSIKALVAEAERLTKAAIEGRLNTRANSNKYQGAYRDIVQGVNDTLDAVIGPLNVAASYVDRISKGDIPPKITDNYNGDFNTIKNNLNVCIDAVNALIEDANMLSVAAVEGRLSTRADATRHKGDFRKIVQGVNDTLDAVIGPVNDAIAILGEMAKGNMSVSVEGDYKGDHALIKNALNKTIDTLNELLNEINVAAEQVAAGSEQVSDSSQALSQGSTEQASSIEELTSSLNEVTNKTRKNAENADQARELAKNAQENAIQGNKQMQEMLKAMDDINESSVNISKIIKVIDEIAFQTNILALNAAVEAARAGQHGKGFAVVAEEVRNLAARSANAAKETTTMIEGSIKKAEAGTKIARDTAEALDKIVDGISKAAGLVGEIAVASNEQAISIEQINQGIEQVSDVVQNNSATAEESASASQELSSQADILKNMVAKFILKKQNQQNNNIGSLKPEIVKALEEMSVKGKGALPKGRRKPSKAEPASMQIYLNDSDFGKY